MIFRNCIKCNIQFKIYPYREEDKTRGKFCSRICKTEYYKGKHISINSEFKKNTNLKENHPNWKGGKPKCSICNKELSAYTSRNCKKCLYINYRGNNHPRFIDNRELLVKSEKKHLDYKYKIWMNEVKNRDNWKCKINNNDCSKKLEAHHILNWKDYPELRYVINNGITLCHAHHPRGRAKEKRLSPYFMDLVSVSKETI